MRTAFLKADGDQSYMAAFSLFSNPTSHYIWLLTALSQTQPVIHYMRTAFSKSRRRPAICGCLQPFHNPTNHYMLLLTAFSKSRPELLLTPLQNSSPENLRVLLTGLGPILSTTEESREGSGGL